MKWIESFSSSVISHDVLCDFKIINEAIEWICESDFCSFVISACEHIFNRRNLESYAAARSSFCVHSQRSLRSVITHSEVLFGRDCSDLLCTNGFECIQINTLFVKCCQRECHPNYFREFSHSIFDFLIYLPQKKLPRQDIYSCFDPLSNFRSNVWSLQGEWKLAHMANE